MLKIELDFQDLYSVIKKLREADDSDFLLEVSENCPFLENLLAFKIIKSEARNLGRKVVFAAKSSDAASLVKTLNDDAESFGFVRGFDVGSAPPFEKVLTTTRINVPLSLLSFLKSKLSLGKDLGFIVAVVAGLLLFAFYLLFYCRRILFHKTEIVYFRRSDQRNQERGLAGTATKAIRNSGKRKKNCRRNHR